MARPNPMNDDLGSRWANARGRNPRRDIPESDPEAKKAWDGPVETYAEKDARLYALEDLYGRQEPPKRYREGRPVR